MCVIRKLGLRGGEGELPGRSVSGARFDLRLHYSARELRLRGKKRKKKARAGLPLPVLLLPLGWAVAIHSFIPPTAPTSLEKREGQEQRSPWWCEKKWRTRATCWSRAGSGSSVRPPAPSRPARALMDGQGAPRRAPGRELLRR